MSNLKFKVYEDKPNEWRWRLVSIGNGKIVADSGEGYKNHSDCISAINLIKAAAATAVVDDPQDALVLALLGQKPSPGTTILGM